MYLNILVFHCFSADFIDKHWCAVTKVSGPRLSVFTVDISAFASEPSFQAKSGLVNEADAFVESLC